MPLQMFQPKNQPKPKHVIGIAAGKGGVGKSSVTVNLALALKHQGYKVGIMDTDIYGPSVRKMLPEDLMPVQKGEIITPALCQGIRMISMAYFRKEQEAAIVRAPIANGLITQFIKNVDWGDLDYLLIDFPPGTGDIQLTLSQQANLTGAVMVTTPQDVAVMDVRKAMNLFDQVKIPIIGIVENMSFYHHTQSNEKIYLFGKGGGERLAMERGVPFLGSIPIYPEISNSGDLGISLFSTTSEAKSSFTDVALQLLKQLKVLENQEVVRRVSSPEKNLLSIEWADGKVSQFSLGKLQSQCPCANCVNEVTGVRNIQPVRGDVEALKVFNVGRYGLRIQFSSGCSTGIYSFDFLKQLAGVNE